MEVIYLVDLKQAPAEEHWKTRFCTKGPNGVPCHRERAHCNFAHATDDFNIGWPPINLRRYKRRMCDRMKAGQFCPYGPRCWYAHDLAELQRRTDTICPLFQAIGECYFLLPGSEHVCPFVHLHEHGAG